MREPATQGMASADEVAVMRIHDAFIDANETWDLDSWVDFIADDCVIFVGDGSVWRGRTEVERGWHLLDDLIEGRWTMPTSNLVLEMHSDAAWLVYEYHLRGTIAGERFDQRGRGTEIYRKNSDTWQIVVGHFSWIQ